VSPKISVPINISGGKKSTSRSNVEDLEDEAGEVFIVPLQFLLSSAEPSQAWVNFRGRVPILIAGGLNLSSAGLSSVARAQLCLKQRVWEPGAELSCQTTA
jgi:hypothetical protein